jgi:hypothetical protein
MRCLDGGSNLWKASTEKRERALWANPRSAFFFAISEERNVTRRYLLSFLKQVSIDENGCWLWQGAPGSTGYGVFYWRRKPISAHRVAYTIYKGEIPQGLEIDHLCRVRLCVNPEHLEAVTHQVNILRGETFAAKNARKAYCPHGHAYDAANTLRYRECNRQRCKIAYQNRTQNV